MGFRWKSGRPMAGGALALGLGFAGHSMLLAADPPPTAPPLFTFKMPGESFSGALPALTEKQTALRDALKADVEHLAIKIGARNTPEHHAKLEEAKAFLEKSLTAAGYKVGVQTFEVKGRPVHNLEVEILGTDRPQEIVVIGAHYDATLGSPAANDNGSGTAATLALARAMVGAKHPRTVRFVLFTNEERYFQTDSMGSLVYARRCKERKENIVAMLSLETIGYYSDAKNSQHYPPPMGSFYPSTGNFIGFIGNPPAAELVKQCVGSFRKNTKFPSEGGALPAQFKGVGWSDHWAFWEMGYPAAMVTDTAMFRYPFYHTPQDTPNKIDFDRTARVVEGLEQVVGDLLDTK